MPTYELSTVYKIQIYKQITDTSCAATCAAMCVKKTPSKLKADGFNLDYADWTGIAQKYGFDDFKQASISGMSTSEALLEVVELLRKGNPVIAKVNNTDDHWVVITSYSGNTTEIFASQFTCADPWTGKFVTLSKATSYKGIYTLRYLYPQNT